MTSEQRTVVIALISGRVLDDVVAMVEGADWNELDAWIKTTFDWDHAEDDTLLANLSDEDCEALGIT